MLRVLSLLTIAFVVTCGLTTAEPQHRLRSLQSLKTPWTGDLDKMLDRGIVRVLVPYSRTLFYHDRGAECGVTVEAVRAFEKYLNSRFRERRVPISVAILPTTRDKLFDDLADGRGDIAAGNITITDERGRDVDFSVPVGPPFTEIIVTSASAPQLNSLEDLGGREVHVRKSTSFYPSLLALNQRLAREGKPTVIVTLLPDDLEDEDVLEMLNANLIQISVKDDWVANLWSDTLPHMRLHPGLRLREESRAGWAFRKGSPLLAAEVNRYVTSVMNKTQVSHASIRRFAENAAKLRNARSAEEWQKFQEVVALFRKYAALYHFDPLLLSAQGYQESHLRQTARSGVGAVGIMQLMPRTATSMHVGDINVVEDNIHAGVKYMDFLMSHFLDDPALTEQNRTLFALAAYNAGPTRLPRLRAEAAGLGLDPNRWLNNVELVAAHRIGLEPVLYVRNIYKYYAAYVLATEAEDKQNRAKKSVKPSR